MNKKFRSSYYSVFGKAVGGATEGIRDSANNYRNNYMFCCPLRQILSASLPLIIFLCAAYSGTFADYVHKNTIQTWHAGWRHSTVTPT